MLKSNAILHFFRPHCPVESLPKQNVPVSLADRDNTWLMGDVVDRMSGKSGKQTADDVMRWQRRAQEA